MLRMSYGDHFLSIVCASVCPSGYPVVRLPLTLSNDNSKAIKVICPLLGKNVAWVGVFKNS